MVRLGSDAMYQIASGSCIPAGLVFLELIDMIRSEVNS